MVDTPNLTMPRIIAAQSQKHVTHNEALNVLDAVVQLSVLDRDLTIPPSSPIEGDRYIPAAPASGDWTGREGQIAAFQDGVWQFYPAVTGWRAWIADEDTVLVHNGSAWTDLPAGAQTLLDLSDTPGDFTGQAGKLLAVNSGETATEFTDEAQSLSLVGVNAAADATNKLSVKSNAVLFDALDDAESGNGNMQAKINKEATADTASVLFQTAFSGRAEFGLTGDDDFHMKVSPDGTIFYEAIVIDKDSGDVSLEQDAALKGYVDISEITVPGNPAANTARLYAYDDSGTTKVQFRDSAGNTTDIGSGGGGGGEANTTSNDGSGTGLAKAKDGVDLPFKSLVAGSAVSISSDTNEVTINADSSPIASVNRNGVTQTGGTASAYNKIQFTTEAEDTDGWFDSTTNYRFTPLLAGWYAVILSVWTNTGTGGESNQPAIYKNGTRVKTGSYFSDSAASGITNNVLALIEMNGTTDYIEGYAWLPETITSLSGNTDVTFMDIFYVGKS